MTEQNEAYLRLKNILKELFQLDQADLDFGIYRIMNQKRDEVTDFLENRLITQVKEILDEHADKDKDKLREELENLKKTLTDAGVDVSTNEKVQKLERQVSQADTTDLQNSTFSHLTNFFKRYYKEGDFISQRRYKDDVYAIPYQGEEVKLHWANRDQYYIKTSEYFKNYRFKLRNGKWVNFELLEASTEQNNNKSQNGERKFKLAEDEIYRENDDTLTIYFTYEPMSKKKKQDKLMDQAFETIKEEVPNKWLTELLQPKPTDKNKKRTLLEKHLKDYTARNTFDYFIHKDLGKFLRRELDFYVKNEILHIDDIDLDKDESYREALQVIKAFKKVGLKIIAFLTQLEEFQKKLWLKKKFVLQSDYCITLDRIDEEFYEEIAANAKQRKEWVELYAIDELDDYSEPLTTDFLKENLFLMVDTQFYGREWKYKLLSTLDHLDDQTGGLMVNSDNYQALRLFDPKYRNSIKGIYIDPPYNTSSSKILYKNDYEHSSWLSLMASRIKDSITLIMDTGTLGVAIDDYEAANLIQLIDGYLGFENRLGFVTVLHNPGGRHDDKHIATAHEYYLLYGKNAGNAETNMLPLGEKTIKKFNHEDEHGKYRIREYRRSGSNSTREARPYMYYPLFLDKNEDLIIPSDEEIDGIYDGTDGSFNDDYLQKLINQYTSEGHKYVLPVDPKGIHRVWRWAPSSLRDRVIDIHINPNKENEGGEFDLRVKDRLSAKEGLKPKSVWKESKYAAASGTNLVKNLFGESEFSYPKSIETLRSALHIQLNENDTILDYFAGSGTTAHATIELNRKDSGRRNYIMVEMGEYFDKVTKPRIEKAVYSKDWKNGKPVDKEGISHMFKYLRLESYEDALNNLSLNRSEQQQQLLANSDLKEEYILNYMLDVEAKDSLLNTGMFKRPFGYSIEATEHNERAPTEVDLVETFNYLIGLHVISIQMIKGYVVVTGNNNDGDHILVIWRDTEKHSNEDLEKFVNTMEFNPLDGEFDTIYVNGDNNLQNLRKDEDTWKVRLIEEEFHKRMFETEGL